MRRLTIAAGALAGLFLAIGEAGAEQVTVPIYGSVTLPPNKVQRYAFPPSGFDFGSKPTVPLGDNYPSGTDFERDNKALNAAWKSAARKAFTRLENQTCVDFYESFSPNGADIRLSFSEQVDLNHPNRYGFTFFGGDVFYDYSRRNETPEPGNGPFVIALHEPMHHSYLGHANSNDARLSVMVPFVNFDLSPLPERYLPPELNTFNGQYCPGFRASKSGRPKGAGGAGGEDLLPIPARPIRSPLPVPGMNGMGG